MIVDGETSYVPIQTEHICNLAIQDFDTNIPTSAEKWHAPEVMKTALNSFKTFLKMI